LPADSVKVDALRPPIGRQAKRGGQQRLERCPLRRCGGRSRDLTPAERRVQGGTATLPLEVEMRASRQAARPDLADYRPTKDWLPCRDFDLGEVRVQSGTAVAMGDADRAAISAAPTGLDDPPGQRCLHRGSRGRGEVGAPVPAQKAQDRVKA
jgi:hypothetical protein